MNKLDGVGLKSSTIDHLSLLPERGVVFGEDSSGSLTDVPIRAWRTRSGDLLAAASHHGFGYKSTNEDRVALAETEGEQGPELSLYVVDGMGGRESGDMAAQILSEELIGPEERSGVRAGAEMAELVSETIAEVLRNLPDQTLIERAMTQWRTLCESDGGTSEPGTMIRLAVEAVNAASVQDRATPQPSRLRSIAEVLRELSGMRPPEPTELALKRARERIIAQYTGTNLPDACFVGALIRTESDGRRMLDIRQVGDCRLFVCSTDGSIRFRTIGESVITEPPLADPDVPLADLMAYSLHRNLVRNSINSSKVVLKQYRKQDVPLELVPGDLIFLYSDGVDDLFTPEELIEMAGGRTPAEFIRQLVEDSERRMKYVNGLLWAERERLSANLKMKAYPRTHERLNRARVEHGRYVEAYRDGVTGSWCKPPKCDNTSMCVMVVG